MDDVYFCNVNLYNVIYILDIFRFGNFDVEFVY